MEFLKFVESRFADPITAIELSLTQIVYGSAMGRLAVFLINTDEEKSLFEGLPELIRGISHSKRGENIYVSIGDVECLVLRAADLNIEKAVQLVDQPD